jgi:hypothetical protein
MSVLIKQSEIQNKIFFIRDKQVILDKDLAILYQVETRVLNQAVKRNIDRFPNDFMFQLSKEEFASLKSQYVISNTNRGGVRKLPYVFTEQGVSMLASVLKTKIAIDVSIQIIRIFVNLKKFASENVLLFDKVKVIENKVNEHDNILKQLINTKLPKTEGIFYDGQIFDAYIFISDLIKKASKSIILIDNYIDESVLLLLSKRKKNVEAKIYTTQISKQLQLDIRKHNSQYPKINIKTFKKSHDRFLIIDNKELYHIGASLKDLGKKWFAFSKINLNINEMLNKMDET